MIALTTLRAWAARGEAVLAPGDELVWVPGGSDDDALAVLEQARDVLGDAQVVALTLDPAPAGPHPPRAVDLRHVAAVRYARRAPDGRCVALLERPPVAEALDLLPHPEGGWFRETWRTAVTFRPPGYPGERASATGIYFFLPPGEESMWHVVRSDEVWFHHHGDPLVLDLGGTGERPGPAEPVLLGPDVTGGQRPQVLIPAGTWQAARPDGPRGTLVSCVVSPGFDFADFRA
ncbi:cupin domain-containing protein [Thermomonospora amylolytica]|uniref:cupin domain-containing protein n=1 Tax=Thermomonospora amylolytica TaxID=1411117 RepID=UPI002D797A84|nr:cupin domain-containing protein [Thermomonospora amylolytica]